MTIKMLPIKDVKEGMILGKDIFDPNSNVLLLTKGKTIKQSHIRFLKIKGIDNIFIRD